MTLLRSSLAAVLLAACSHPATPAQPISIAVPLTAATAQIATAQVTHQDLVPWSLTASDGSGLAVTRVEAKAVHEGPLAYTELHLWFHNPESRRREGTFQITLPAHAAVSRFAMENDGAWMEAEVVEKQLARRAYDDFLHRKQDPALLEKAEGNQFTAKVFPIAPNADKHIVISFSQELPGAAYALPLKGLPKIGRVDIDLKTRGPDGKLVEQGLHEANWQPDRDFVSTAPSSATAVMAGTLVASQVTIGGTATAHETPTGITLLVDTSASRALGYDAYVASIKNLIVGMRASYGDITVQVVAFDQDAETIYTGAISGFAAAQVGKLVDRGAAGASDLGQALAFVGKTAQSRIVVVTDGVVTAGAEGDELAAKVKQLGAQRLDVVLSGGIRNDQLARELVRTLPHAGTVLDADTDDVVLALAQPVATDIPVSVAGAAWVYPKSIPSARIGERVMVYARLARPSQMLDVTVGSSHEQLAMLGGTVPLVERAVAGAEIDELEARLASAKVDQKPAIKDAIVKKSLASRVVSSETSMLVLETEDDYARYGIDRKALADILVVGPSGLEREHRTSPGQLAIPEVATKQEQTKAPAKELALSGADPGTIGGDQSGVADDKTSAPSAEPAAPPPPPAPVTAAPPREMDVPKAEKKKADDDGDFAPRASGAMARPVAADEDDEAPRASRRHRAPDPDDEALEENEGEAWPPPGSPPALNGELADIEHRLQRHDVAGALADARDWHAREPGNVLALIGLGDALEAHGSKVTAARVYGSIIDLFPGRADMRRFAGERLARVDSSRGADLIVDTYRRAVADRPDHLTGRRLLAYALFRSGKPAEAFDAILAGIDQPYPDGRFAGGERVLAEDAGMIGAALIEQQPAQRKHVMAELAKRNLSLVTQPSTRFILYWETDGNDVDFHIQDAHHGHAFYASPHLPSGGDLYADITTGYGPECFAIQGTPKAGPYRLSINYYSQGPMGYGMGLLEVQRFDGKGKLSFEDRPYVIMNDQAYVDLGKI
jgi:hypothetical protein